MTEYPIILDPAAMRCLFAGRKTQVRVLGVSPLRECLPGDRLWVKERCIGGKTGAGDVGDVTAKMSRAEFIIFADGWRQYRCGSGHAGAIPTGRNVKWTTGIHMPRWATRATLAVESVRTERLQDIERDDIVAEGDLSILAGLCWRWRNPMRSLWRGVRAGYAALWNASHATRGERWEDNPEVVVLSFRPELRRAG